MTKITQSEKKTIKNVIMLYIMAVAKLIFPLLTLPYLTRVLSEDSYGFVSYEKSCMTYIQLVTDFGFILSSVKDIVNANGDLEKIGYITGNTIASKMVLCAISSIALVIMCLSIEVLQLSLLFVLFSFISVAVSSFLVDFLFRGIEKMHYITTIYLISKFFSIVLTFILVKDDSDIILIPVLDVLTSVISVIISLYIVSRLKIKIRVSGIRDCFNMIKDSFVYFLSSVATTVFAALNTILIGIFIKDLTQVAYWSLCFSIIGAIQGLYAPITNSIYPHMIREKSLRFIHKTLLVIMPVVTLGCVICIVFSDFVMLVVGGEKYISAARLFCYFVPVLFFSFPAQLYGWPTLGAIGKVKETTFSTVVAAIFQIVGIIVLVLFKQFNLVTLIILRDATEFCLMAVRMYITYSNKDSFVGDNYLKIKPEA